MNAKVVEVPKAIPKVEMEPLPVVEEAPVSDGTQGKVDIGKRSPDGVATV